MKELFLIVCGLLETVPALKWIDKDKAQLEIFDTKPAVAFPCALVKVELSECHSIGGKLQNCTALVTIKLGWDFFTSDTATTAPDEARARSLAYYDTGDAIYAALEGYFDMQVNELERTSVKEYINKGGNTIMLIPFSTTFTDETAAA